MGFDPASAHLDELAGVLGLGRSGQSAAKLLHKKGFRVLGSDLRSKAELRPLLRGLPQSIQWECGGHSARLLKCSFVVKSPGLNPSLPIFKKLAESGIAVYSELEIALAYSKAKTVVAITGTNGKSTTAQLTWAIFKAGLPRGRKAFLGGNIGIPATSFALETRETDVLILECSSYQLEDSSQFKPRVAAMLNISADHLDHHGSMAVYLKAKAKIFRGQEPSGICVFNADDPAVYKLSRECPAQRLYFGAKGVDIHAWEEGGKIFLRTQDAKKKIALVPPKLPGKHNLENAMAAGLMALALGLKPAAIQKAFAAFKGIEHRLEACGSVRGIACVNDSKATNVDSTAVALRAHEHGGKRLILILGGLHKGSPYAPLKPWIVKLVKGILTIGDAARRIEKDLSALAPIFPCGNLKTAVETGLKIGVQGDTLLFSPACASFDQFLNFEDRGRCFKALIAAAGEAE